jgi:hypothetical protein
VDRKTDEIWLHGEIWACNDEFIIQQNSLLIATTNTVGVPLVGMFDIST